MRFTNCIGLPVVEEGSSAPIATISGILVHPDTGAVEGFFVRASAFFSVQQLFLGVEDIRHFGMRITVRNDEVLGPLEERVRLAEMHDSGRTILGQRVLTKDGVVLGRCFDVQFSTTLFRIEWLFVKKFFRTIPPIATADVLEVRPDAVVVRSRQALLPAEEGGISVESLLPAQQT